MSDRCPVKVEALCRLARTRVENSVIDVLEFERGQLRQELMRFRDVAVFWDSIKVEETRDNDKVTLRAYGYGYANDSERYGYADE